MDEIILKVPGSHKALAAAMQNVVDHLARFTSDAARRQSVDYRAHEGVIAEASAAIEREAHGVSLAALDIDEARLRIDGVIHHRVGRHVAAYKTRVGVVPVGALSIARAAVAASAQSTRCVPARSPTSGCRTPPPRWRIDWHVGHRVKRRPPRWSSGRCRTRVRASSTSDMLSELPCASGGWTSRTR